MRSPTVFNCLVLKNVEWQLFFLYFYEQGILG